MTKMAKWLTQAYNTMTRNHSALNEKNNDFKKGWIEAIKAVSVFTSLPLLEDTTKKDEITPCLEPAMLDLYFYVKKELEEKTDQILTQRSNLKDENGKFLTYNGQIYEGEIVNITIEGNQIVVETKKEYLNEQPDYDIHRFPVHYLYTDNYLSEMKKEAWDREEKRKQIENNVAALNERRKLEEERQTYERLRKQFEKELENPYPNILTESDMKDVNKKFKLVKENTMRILGYTDETHVEAIDNKLKAYFNNCLISRNDADEITMVLPNGAEEANVAEWFGEYACINWGLFRHKMLEQLQK